MCFRELNLSSETESSQVVADENEALKLQVSTLTNQMSAVMKELKTSKSRQRTAQRIENRNIQSNHEPLSDASVADGEFSSRQNSDHDFSGPGTGIKSQNLSSMSTSDLEAGLSDVRPNMSEGLSDPCGTANWDSPGSAFEERAAEINGPEVTAARMALEARVETSLLEKKTKHSLQNT
jgi:hypothetical protein